MRDLPTGTVTFLFTDVEGSTQLLHEHGDAYAGLLADHRRALREVFGRHGGVEVDTQGDAFFVAFASAREALAAAEEGQAALDGGPIRVRIGLHTGEAHVTDEGYVGLDVHRAARIAAAGHGGQTLLSRSTRDLVQTGVRDLGEHRLKDLSAAERLYQLGENEFPPLKTLYRTNLPVPATPFLGRDAELAEVSALLARDDVRLVTLTGPGGTGKTRLALQVAGARADAYPDGVFWVPLAPLADPRLVLESAALVVGAKAALAEHLSDRKLLLVLDNFEHLVPAAADVSELLGSCPGLDLLVTSRELLQLAGEHAYPVPPLAPPEGIELFLSRARAVDPAFEGNGVVAELCERLDRLPLAIELAAARTRHLSPEQLLDRLSQRLDLLKGGRDADPRQQTLRATIHWSFDLLDDEEQALFARLAVFAGGWTLEAAEAVCGAGLDILGSLVDKSLVRRREGDRYWMLETIREFAAERLVQDGEEAELRRRHAEYFLDLAGSLGMTMEAIESIGTQRHTTARAEWDNLRAAIDWAIDADFELAVRIAVQLENFWVSRSPFDSKRLFEDLLQRADELPVELRPLVFRCLANTLIITGERERGTRLYEESLELYRRLGDERGAAIVQLRVGTNVFGLGDHERGRALVEESLEWAPVLGLRTLEAQALGLLGAIEQKQGNLERAVELVTRSVGLAREVGFTWWERNMLDRLAHVSIELGSFDSAEVHGRAALVLCRRMDDRLAAVAMLALLARTAAGRGDAARGGRLWGAVEGEAARGALGIRDEEREELAGPVLALSSPEFERARGEGRVLSLPEAVDEALEDA